MTALEEYDRHQQWAASLGDNAHLLLMSEGHRWLMLLVAHMKYLLQQPATPAGLKLQLLEQIERAEDWYLTNDMIQTIQEMGPDEIAIYDQARSLDREGDHGKNSYPVLVKSWDLFCRLNPSFNKAIRLKVEKLINLGKSRRKEIQ